MGQAIDQTTIQFEGRGRTFTPTLGDDGRIVLGQPAPRTEQTYGVANLEAAARCSRDDGKAMFEQKSLGLQQRMDQNQSLQPNPATPGFTMVDKPKGPSA
ncbi:MAG: hypothetical protein JWO78_855 [Micavibrio sp.]|nr:hypothetical protein [Micavibrio sp.]